MAFEVIEVAIAVMLGTLAAIVYSLRVLVIMEKRIGNIERHISHVVDKIAREEIVIEKEILKKRSKRSRK